MSLRSASLGLRGSPAFSSLPLSKPSNKPSVTNSSLHETESSILSFGTMPHFFKPSWRERRASRARKFAQIRGFDMMEAILDANDFSDLLPPHDASNIEASCPAPPPSPPQPSNWTSCARVYNKYLTLMPAIKGGTRQMFLLYRSVT